ncbi:MAG: hypothetical protein HQM11_17230 [SAR324 cluster bacterium]|nr:hypothetical protein [SAR324 cluster bacterium]
MTTRSDPARETINALKEQIRLYQDQNKLLQRSVEDIKATQQYLVQQLEMLQQHEKMSLIREQRDFERIVDLENKLVMISQGSGITYAALESMPNPKMVQGSFRLEDHFILHPGQEISSEEPEIEVPYNDEDMQVFIDKFASVARSKKPKKPQTSASTETSADKDVPPVKKQSGTKTAQPRAGQDTVAKQEKPHDNGKPLFQDVAESSIHTKIPDQAAPAENNSTDETTSVTTADAEQTSEAESVDSPTSVFEEVAKTTVSSENEPVAETPSAIFEDDPATSAVSEQPIPEATTKQQPAIQTVVESPPVKPEATKPPPEPEPVETEEALHQRISRFFNMGLEASERKNYAEAIDYFSKVTSLLPTSSPSFLNLAILYYRLEQYEEAARHARSAIELGSDPARRLLVKIETELEQEKIISLKSARHDT